jgi:chromosome segregation ATPase
MSFSTYNREGRCRNKKREVFVIKKKNSPNRRKKQGAINQRISASKTAWDKRGKHKMEGLEERGTLENRLRKIEEYAMETKEHRENLENILRKIEKHMMEAKEHRGKFENILVELGEVKQHLVQRNSEQPRRQRVPRFSRKQRRKGEADIQTTPAEEMKNGKETREKGGFLQDFLGNVDFAQITNLFQNPMLQSMLKSMLSKTG